MVEVERILLTEWDPIGVKGEPMAECEYCSYAGIVTSMLVHGSSEDEVATYLEHVERRMMSMDPPQSERCVKAAHECKALLA
jgi:hypothetical protein